MVAVLALLGACARSAPPEQVALRYGQALYAYDVDALWALISDADRRVKDRATFERQYPRLAGFGRQVMDQLAGFVSATATRTAVNGERATVTLRFRLPDANDPGIRALLHDWDEDVLGRLNGSERRRIRERLDALHRQGALPTVEGDETFELVREAGAWRIFLDWAGGVRVRFGARVEPGLPLEVTVTPASVVLSPGDRVRVTLRATNTGRRPVTARVGHRVEPAAHREHLALLLCPLFVPVTLAPGQSEEFTSEYLLLPDTPRDVEAVEATYVFPGRAS